MPVVDCTCLSLPVVVVAVVVPVVPVACACVVLSFALVLALLSFSFVVPCCSYVHPRRSLIVLPERINNNPILNFRFNSTIYLRCSNSLKIVRQ